MRSCISTPSRVTALIHQLMMMHYAPGNTTDRRRRIVGHKFAGDDATYAVREGPFRVLPPWDPELKIR